MRITCSHCCTRAWIEHHATILLAGIVVLGIALRLLYLFLHDFLPRDSYAYLAAVDCIRMGKPVPDPTLPPLLLMVMVGGAWCGIGAKTAGLLLNMACGAFVPILGFLIAKRLFISSAYAVGVALLLACQGELIRLSAVILRDIPYLLVLLTTIYWCMWAEDSEDRLRTVFRCIGIVILGIMLLLLRREGLELFLILACWSLLPVFQRNFREAGRRLSWTVPVVICLIAAVGLIQRPLLLYGFEWNVIPWEYARAWWYKLTVVAI